MKLYVSYFYQVRNMSEDVVPFSTAKYDPRWFHDFKGPDHVFVDSNAVVNGLRLTDLTMPEAYVDELTRRGCMCSKGCSITPPCEFMRLYEQHLDSLDFEAELKKVEAVLDVLSKMSNLQPEAMSAVLLVHEKPTCLCAERPVLKKWFRKHGYELEEWQQKQ